MIRINTSASLMAIAVAGTALLTPGIAAAAGCNGVVAPQVWGCAPWDNNNGPQFPNYKPPKTSKPVQPTIRSAPAPQTQLQKVAPNTTGGRIIGNNGGNIIGNNGGGIITNNGANVVGNGGNTMRK